MASADVYDPVDCACDDTDGVTVFSADDAKAAAGFPSGFDEAVPAVSDLPDLVQASYSSSCLFFFCSSASIASRACFLEMALALRRASSACILLRSASSLTISARRCASIASFLACWFSRSLRLARSSSSFFASASLIACLMIACSAALISCVYSRFTPLPVCVALFLPAPDSTSISSFLSVSTLSRRLRISSKIFFASLSCAKRSSLLIVSLGTVAGSFSRPVSTGLLSLSFPLLSLGNIDIFLLFQAFRYPCTADTCILYPYSPSQNRCR